MQDREPRRGRSDPQGAARTRPGGRGDETPPGGDVRAVYAAERDPGEAEPEAPRPS